MGRVSGKTHTKAQLDHWANLHNPNNKAYQADADNRANQMNPAANFERMTSTYLSEVLRTFSGCVSMKSAARRT